jgi:glutaredoxin
MGKVRRHRLLLAILGLLAALLPLLVPAQAGASEPVLEVFVREGCPHCARAEAFLPELRQQRPGLEVRLRRLDSDPAAIDDLIRVSRQVGIQAPGVPTFVIAGQVLVGFDDRQEPVSSFLVNPVKERWFNWLLERFGFPWIYWNRMLTGQPHEAAYLKPFEGIARRLGLMRWQNRRR